MKFYHYISKEKVDMLLPQIPVTEKKKVSAKIGFNIGILTGEIAEERLSLDDKVNRAKTVSDYICTFEDVGEVSSDSPWIIGKMNAFLGHFPSAKSAVFFIGNTENTNIVLGGSTGNLISQQNSSDMGYGQSYLPYLIETMHSCIDTGIFLEEIEDTTEYLSRGVGYPGQPSPWYELVDKMQDFKQEPIISIEFLARRLVRRAGKSHASILASPIYVYSH